jgi:hypothetical protein
MPLTFQGATGATGSATSVALPTHAVGDIIVIYADRTSTGAAPGKPSAGGTVPTWTDITVNNTNGLRTAYAVATATNHTSGTWTTGGTRIAVVLSGQASIPIGGAAVNYSSSVTTSVTAPAITMSDTRGNSQILHFYTATSGSFSWSAAPGGYTSRLSVDGTPGTPGYRVLTKNTTTSDGAIAQSIGSGPSQGWSASVEVLAAPSSGFFLMF